jgi:hypothetical protein
MKIYSREKQVSGPMRTKRGIIQNLEREAEHIIKRQSVLHRKIDFWPTLERQMADVRD